MEYRLGVVIAFALGAVIGYKWPAISRALAPYAKKLERGAIRGPLAIKKAVANVSAHVREVAAEVTAEAEAKT